MTESQILLEADLNSARFLAGTAKGRWKFIRISWPYLYVSVFTARGFKIVLRFECTGYPQQPPTSAPWNMETDQLLEGDKWPTGSRVSKVFRRDWQGGAALYLPCDRVSVSTHPNWMNEYPSMIWKPVKGIIQYLEIVHEILQSRDDACEPA